MELLLYILTAWCIVLLLNINILIRDVKVLKKEMLQLRSIIRKRQAGQSWEEIPKLDNPQNP